MPGGFPVGLVDLGPDAVDDEAEAVHVPCRGAVTAEARNAAVHRPTPHRVCVSRAGMASRIGTGFPDGVPRPPILEFYVPILVNMESRVYVSLFRHAFGRDTCLMAFRARPVEDRVAVAVVAGEIRLHVTWMGICPSGPGSLVGEHRERSLPVLACRPLSLQGEHGGDVVQQEFLVSVVAGYTGTFRVPVARIALHSSIRPRNGANEVGVPGPIAVAIDIVTYLGTRGKFWLRPVRNLPLGGEFHIDTVEMFGRILNGTCRIHGSIMAIVAGVFSDPLRPYEPVMTVAVHSESRGAVPSRAAPDAEY